MPDAADRLQRALSDRYRIERELGTGGMATVWLAEDLKHDRKVAIKVLKPELTAVLGGDRFIQEIKTTAALSHPHILPLFDSGTADGFLYYVMPYLEAETVREKLNREKQLGVDEAVKIATEVADALDYAHRHGIIHRDIKPENILLHDGRPMVMDFGIALAVSAAAGGRMTETGLSLGTPHYMSPEQATADREITSRSDIYSLASVLYEMLAGVPPHEGGTAQQTIMRIIADTPRPVSELRRSVPPNVAAAVMKALEKLPADRFESAKAFADALADPGFTVAALGPGTPARADVRAIRWWIRSPWSWVALAGLGLAAVLLVSRDRGEARSPDGSPQAFVTRDSIPPGGWTSIDVAVDGTVGWTDSAGIVVRPPGALEPRLIGGTRGSQDFSFSPDGTRIVFVDGAQRTLRTVPVSGGSTRTLTSGENTIIFPVWGEDGWVYFETQTLGAGALYRVPDGGGDAEVLLKMTAPQRKAPSAVLARGRALLYTAEVGREYRVMLLDLETRDTTELLPDGAGARWIPGYLVYVASANQSRAVPFDLRRLRLAGSPVPVRDDVSAYGLAVNPGGTLAYHRAAQEQTTFSLVNEAGDRESLPIAPTDHWDIAISPDGRSAAYTRDNDIWIFDLDRGGSFPLTEGRTGRHNPVWSPDGARVIYASVDGLRVRPVDRSAEPQPVPGTTGAYNTDQWLDDGTILLEDNEEDIGVTRLDEGASPRMLLEADWREAHPSVSPDGRWIAYLSDRDIRGSLQLHVRRWPDLTDEAQVSSGEVPLTLYNFPQWSQDSRTLYYIENDRIIAADMSTGPDTVVRGRRTLPVALKAGAFLRGIHPDGRLLIVEPRDAQPGQIIVVSNWFTELRNRLGKGAASGR